MSSSEPEVDRRDEPRVPPAAGAPQPLRTSSTLEAARETALHPVFISLGLPQSAFSEVMGGRAPASTESPSKLGVTAMRGIDQWSDRVWLFKGGSYAELRDAADSLGEWRSMSDWAGWPPSFSTGFDAAVQGSGRFRGWYYFFAGDKWIGYNQAEQTVKGPPRPIEGSWQGVAAPFTGGIDAALHGATQKYYGKAWLFKGSEYLRYDMDKSAVDIPPRPISQGWGQGSWPPSFDRIDFCWYGAPPHESDTIFFFCGDQFITYDLKADTVTSAPRPIAKKWPALRSLIKRPQLFLEEHYRLHRFLGESGRGEPLDTIGLAGGATQESKIVTKINMSRVSESKRNILESTSSTAVDAVADKTNADSGSSFASEDYGYEGRMSARGEVNWTGLGGDGKVDVGFQGSTKDVRHGFIDSLRNELAESSSRTNETNKEETSIESLKYAIDETTETELVYTFNNSTSSDPVNFAIVQLTQEFIVLLSLYDARLTFLNGRPEDARSVPLRQASTMIAEVIADASTREIVLANLEASLSGIEDVNGESRDFVVRTDGDIQVAAKLATTYRPTNSQGEIQRTIVVPGIAVEVERPVILTTNTIIVPLI